MEKTSLSSGKLLSKSGEVETSSLNDVPVVLYYFSAHWCPPCRGFTPVLIKAYNEWNKDKKQVEVVFVTSDEDDQAFAEYYKDMPWLAIPYGDDRIEALGTEFGVSGIPSLCVVGKDGKLLSKDGRGIVAKEGGKAVESLLKLYNK